jgi:hypothetical protein
VNEYYQFKKYFKAEESIIKENSNNIFNSISNNKENDIYEDFNEEKISFLSMIQKHKISKNI